MSPDIDNSRRRLYTSARGVKVSFLPLPPTIMGTIETAYERDVPKPQPPTYMAEALGGVSIPLTHTEETVKGDPSAEAEWDAYQKALNEWLDVVNTRLAQYVQINCMEFEMPEDEEWIERQQFCGIDVPDGRLARRLHYIKTEVVGSQDDMVNVLAIPMQLAMERSADLVAAERMFRLGVEKRAEAVGANGKATQDRVADEQEPDGGRAVGEVTDGA